MNLLIQLKLEQAGSCKRNVNVVIRKHSQSMKKSLVIYIINGDLLLKMMLVNAKRWLLITAIGKISKIYIGIPGY